MSFRLPMLFAVSAAIAIACSSKPSGDDTDVSDTDIVDTNVQDTDVADTDLVVCDASSDTDTNVLCSSCVTCAAPTSCPTEYAACMADADCSALIGCIGACADETCVSACVETHSAGQALAEPIQMCAVASCPNSCDQAGGEPAASSFR